LQSHWNTPNRDISTWKCDCRRPPRLWASILIDLTPAQDYTRSSSLLASMGLTQAQVISLPDPNSPVQYRLILGYDYQACFQPESLAP
jgi:hypothetical protein